MVNTLTNYTCLIIDALDKEHFDSRQSYIFYRLVDAQLTRLKPGSMIIATSKDLPLLADHFEERDYFIATMDRILELFRFTGEGIQRQTQGRRDAQAHLMTHS